MERALSNLVILREEEVIKNRWVAQSLESKLPSSLKEKWIAHKTESVNGFAPHDHFDCLLRFLKKQEAILEELDQLEASPREKLLLSERPGRQFRKRSQESVLQSYLRPKRVSVEATLGLVHCLC